MTSFKISVLLFLVSGSFSACKEEPKPVAPTPSLPTPVAKPIQVELAMSSVTLLEDCIPEAEEEPPAGAEAKREFNEAVTENEADMDMDRAYTPPRPCSQSTMQISIESKSETPATLTVLEVRLVGPKGKSLGIMKASSPTYWLDNTYQPWDQAIAPMSKTKSSYKVSFRGWGNAEKVLGGTTYGPTFQVEADLLVGGTRQTIRSSKIVRERAEMVET